MITDWIVKKLGQMAPVFSGRKSFQNFTPTPKRRVPLKNSGSRKLPSVSLANSNGAIAKRRTPRSRREPVPSTLAKTLLTYDGGPFNNEQDLDQDQQSTTSTSTITAPRDSRPSLATATPNTRPPVPNVIPSILKDGGAAVTKNLTGRQQNHVARRVNFAGDHGPTIEEEDTQPVEADEDTQPVSTAETQLSNSDASQSQVRKRRRRRRKMVQGRSNFYSQPSPKTKKNPMIAFKSHEKSLAALNKGILNVAVKKDYCLSLKILDYGKLEDLLVNKWEDVRSIKVGQKDEWYDAEEKLSRKIMKFIEIVQTKTSEVVDEREKVKEEIRQREGTRSRSCYCCWHCFNAKKGTPRSHRFANRSDE